RLSRHPEAVSIITFLTAPGSRSPCRAGNATIVKGACGIALRAYEVPVRALQASWGWLARSAFKMGASVPGPVGLTQAARAPLRPELSAQPALERGVAELLGQRPAQAGSLETL